MSVQHSTETLHQMSDRANPISATVPFDEDGVHHGFLTLPWSRDDSAWGALRIPLTVIRNGTGPTALITGGNHGDEYEGPLAVSEFANSAKPSLISGRVICVPFMNYPAFQAGKRTSPIDGGNMNRLFPGRADGSVSEKIAHYFQTILLPMADCVLDFHSGGKTLDFLPFAASHVLDNEEQQARCAAARDAFGAPYSLLIREIDSAGMYDDAAEAAGKTFVTTELCGGGTATPKSIAIARRGLRNFLIHCEILAGAVEPSKVRILVQPDQSCFHFAPDAGLLEPAKSLGDTVQKGDIVARIWSTTHTGRPPFDITANRNGLLIARHFPGLVQPGDCLAVLAVDA